MKPVPRKPRGRQRGVAAVEFAAILPVLILLISFIAFFGRLCWYYTAAYKAAHDGATMLAMARVAEVGAKTPSLTEVEIAQLVREIVKDELAELAPGNGNRPVIDVRCDGVECIGDMVPTQVSVRVRMNMISIVLPVFVEKYSDTNDFWFYAEVKVAYVGV